MMGIALRTAEGEASWALTSATVCCSCGLAEVHLAVCLLPVRSGLTCLCPELHIWSCSFASVTNSGCSNFWIKGGEINTSAVKLKNNTWGTDLQSVSSCCWQGCLTWINTTRQLGRETWHCLEVGFAHLIYLQHLQAKMAHKLRIDLRGQHCLLLNYQANDICSQ